MNIKNIYFDLKKEELSSNNKKNPFVEKLLDIDFFNSRKSRILDNIKFENSIKKLNKIPTTKLKQLISSK